MQGPGPTSLITTAQPIQCLEIIPPLAAIIATWERISMTMLIRRGHHSLHLCKSKEIPFLSRMAMLCVYAHSPSLGTDLDDQALPWIFKSQKGTNRKTQGHKYMLHMRSRSTRLHSILKRFCQNRPCWQFRKILIFINSWRKNYCKFYNTRFTARSVCCSACNLVTPTLKWERKNTNSYNLMASLESFT